MDFEVLILGSDANAYYMARCAYEAYQKRAYLIGAKRLAFTKYSNILHISYNPKLWEENEFLRALDTFQKEHKDKKIILISTNETYTEFMSKNENRIHENYLFCVPSLHTIRSLTNKENFYKTYKNYTLTFPKTIYYTPTNTQIMSSMEYPVVVKPANVVLYNHLSFEGKKKIYKAKNEEELNEIITRIKDSGYTDKLIIQEFIPGGDDMLFDSVVYVNGSGKVEFMTFAQIGLQERTKSMVGNAAVLINGFNTTKGNVESQVQNIKTFMETIHYHGFAEIDMKYDSRDNTFKVLEINARQGRCSYYVTPLGKNLVKTIVDDVLYHKEHDFEYLSQEVLLSFVPKGILKKYIDNKLYKKHALKLWRHVIKPMDCKLDKNFKRFLLLRKRWFHYYQEYKNGYWK